MRVPERAVRPGKQVWVVRDGRLAVVTRVRLVELVDGDVEDSAAQPGRPVKVWLVDAASGLQAGDDVVVSPLAAAWDGMPVREGGGR
jgi:hypothetical protein